MAGLSTGFVLWTWHRLGQIQSDRENQAEFRHSDDIPLGVSYFGKYYLYRDDTGIRAFSTTCTHAGCRIGKENAGFLQCSCHGSKFEAETGRPVKGPALKPLQELECHFDQTTGHWIIKLQPSAVPHV
ncbi:MAG TPA: Rieske (2Fe-2S) protein [Prolixibacteraceae bacterium]|nr:Rieske (2Fe-2S) protein [Prolixibacteraceae bacterium]